MKFSKKKKIIVGIVIVAAVIAGLAIHSNLKSTETKGLAVSTSDVVKKDIRSTLSLKAPLAGTENIEVVSRLHYEITAINVKEGDKVEKNQVIAILNSSDLQDEIEKLRDNLELLKLQNSESKSGKNTSVTIVEERIKDEIEKSQRSYEAGLETLKTAKTNFENLKVLFNSGMSSQKELTDSENAYNEAQRNVDSFNVVNGKVVATDSQLADLKNAKVSASDASGSKSIEIARKELERKQKDLEDCKIKSSINGTVTRVNAKVGRFADEIDDKRPMFEIENMDNLKMVANVSEYDIAKVAIGQRVDITADILAGETVEGVVSRISPTGELKQGGTNERVIPVQIDVTSTSDRLIAGINASAKIETAKFENALVIPTEAYLDNGDDTSSVFVVQDGNKIKKINVKLGVEDILEAQVISDELKEGDKVVLNPDYSMEDGMSVIVNE